MAVVITVMKITISPANFLASIAFLSINCEKIGTNAGDKAPSASILRKEFGILNATKKISVDIPAPIYRAITMSLKNPLILDKVVKNT